MKILVSQPKPTGVRSPYFDLETQFDVDVIFRPFIKVVGISDKDFRAQHVHLLDYTAVIFTSRHSIDHYFQMAKTLRINIPESMKYFCVSETISLYIQKYVQYRKRKVFFGPTGRLADLVPLMVKHKSEKYLFPVSNVNSGSDGELLASEGLNFKQCVLYKTVSNDFRKNEIFDYDLVVLFSPTGVNTLIKDFPDMPKMKTQVATFGPATTARAKEVGLNLVVEAPTEECPSMPAALHKYLREIKK